VERLRRNTPDGALSWPTRALVVHSSGEAVAELRDVLAPVVPCDVVRSTDEALARFAAADYAVVVLDHRPPEFDATEALQATLAAAPEALVVLMTAQPDAARALDEKVPGRVFRFLGGTDQRWQLPGIVTEALRLIRVEREQRDLVRRLGAEYTKLQKREKLLDVVVKERTRELEAAYLRLKAANRQALLGLAEAIEAKDAYTKGHCGRVATYTMALAEACSYPRDEMETLEFASFLHDIGKIGVRDAVLLKPAALDADEWIHMRTHPVVGDTIAAQIEMLKPMRPAIRNHHERWDGKGYPDGLKGADVPLGARIVCITDAFDAMITDRPYKKAFPYAECLALLRKGAGAQFDPDLVELFCKERVGEDDD
jgi:response regulator RpfG family c-di-GMP phosphodiesterase